MIRIKNADTVEHVWQGQTLQPGEYHTIDPLSVDDWANNEELLAAITAGLAVVNSGGEVDIEDVGSAINYLTGGTVESLTASDPFTTSARYPSFSPITGFTLTPPAGEYACSYSASVSYTTFPRFHKMALYINDTQVEDTLRSQDTTRANQVMSDATQGVVKCSGLDVISVGVACDATGALTVNHRTLILTRT